MDKITALYDSAELQAIVDRNDPEELREVVNDYFNATLLEIDNI